MATYSWRGDVQATYDVWTLTIANTWATNDTLTVTVNKKDLTLTVGAVTTTDGIATAFAAAWNGDAVVGTETRNTTGPAVPEMAEYSAAASSSTVIFTAVTAGIPGTLTTSSSTAGTGDSSFAHTTTATGPNSWDDAENWDDGSGGTGVPGVGDTVNLRNSSVDILYGLSNAGSTLAAINQDASYTGKIGLPEYREGSSYYEYRTRELTIDCTAYTAGLGDGQGSGRTLINFGTVQTAIKVFKTGGSLDSGRAAFRLRGTHASNTIEVSEGSVDFAYNATGVAATVRCGHEGNIQSDVQLRLGPSVTLTTVNQTGGFLEINSAFTTLTKLDGETRIKGSGARTTMNLWGGTCWDNGTGTATTVNQGESVLDRRETQLGVTYTTHNIYKGAEIHDPQETITWTNPINLKGCQVKDVTLDIGVDIALQRS